MSPYVVAFIFARGGSKGIPRKNLRVLDGKPLLVWAIEIAQSIRRVGRVVVSTDDEEIAEVGRAAGAEVPFLRPAELARDDSPEWLAWQHALCEIEKGGARRPDAFLSLPPTAPFREVQDVDACLDQILEGSSNGPPPDLAITVTEADANPFFNLVQIDEKGLAHRVLECPDKIDRRQEAPPVYQITTVAYAARPEFVRSGTGVYAGLTHAVVIPRERALDIDSEFDLRIAEALVRDSNVSAEPA